MIYNLLDDITEDWDFIIADTQKLMQQKEDLKNSIDRQGKESSQELADRMLEEAISRKRHIG